MPEADILLPTFNRLNSLIMTLAGIAGQELMNFHLVLADQSDIPVTTEPVIQSLLRVLEVRGATVEVHHRRPLQGIAEQRQFLLESASSSYVLYIDDDVWMEPWVLESMLEVIQMERCGFVGAFPAGLSFREDERPEQQRIEFWEGPVQPEVVNPGSPDWERWQLHRAANIYHLGKKLSHQDTRLYKVAWVAACILYDRQKLVEIGGFSFWDRLPRFHSGEEVLVQNLLMRRWGGCGMIPSGTFSSEVPSTVLNMAGGVDGHALDLLPEMVARYAPDSAG